METGFERKKVSSHIFFSSSLHVICQIDESHNELSNALLIK